MRLLFVHQNFPGQFKHLFKALQSCPGYELRALSLRENGPDSPQIINYHSYLTAPPRTGLVSDDFAVKVARGTACARAAQALKLNGFEPDIIVGHPGWGELLFIREVYPAAKLICLFEFFYNAHGFDVGFDPEFPPVQDDIWGLNVKNAANLFALQACDTGLCPTQFQRSTYPDMWHDKLAVCHEGIDTDRIKADPDAHVKIAGATFRRGDGIVTYVSRNLEPYRGFHTFMRALPRILKDNSAARVIVLGGDGVSYGHRPPGGRTWKDTLQSEIGDQADWSRAHFLGAQPYDVYLKILQISTVHVYLTYPFFLSWSLLEAMAAECAIVASATPPVEEVIKDGKEGVLVDFFDTNRLSKAIGVLLKNKNKRQKLGNQARRKIIQDYDLKTIAIPRQLNLLGLS